MHRRRPLVLVADDEQNAILLLNRVLEREGFDVESARDGLSTLAKARELKPDLILLDVQMPHLNGFEVTARLREDPETGRKLEPVEEVVIDLDEEYAGVVVEKLSKRKAELLEMKPAGAGKLRLVFKAPARALIGYHGEFLTDTRGTGVMNRTFAGFEPWKGPIQQRHTGVLVSTEQGEAVAYALWYLQERGPLFVSPGEKVYSGMIIGEHTRDNDLEVNPLREKKLTNIRAAGKDDNVLLTPPVVMTLEKAIAYIAEDELVEVTPKAIRLRKRLLDPHARRRAARQKEVA